MAIKFCTDCGKKLEYKFSPPKFCSDCGAPIGAVSASVKESKPEKQVSRRIEALSDNETDAEYVPSLAKLEYEIDDFGASVQQTMGSLAGKRPPSRKQRSVRDINDL